MKNYSKPKRQPLLMTDVIKYQVFAWNKYVEYYCVCLNCANSFQCALIFDLVNDLWYVIIKAMSIKKVILNKYIR